MEPKYNNQILIIFLFSILTLINHVTQAIFVASYSIHTTTSLSTASSQQQQSVPPPQTDISSPNQSPDQSKSATNIFSPRDLLPPNSKIKRICESTDYPSLCWPYISTFYSGKSDATTVLEMAINATAQQIKMAQFALAKLAEDPKFLSDKKNSNLLDDCKEMYDDALDNLKSARDAIPKGDIITVNIMLSAALTDFSTCADGFTGKNSPVGGIDTKLNKLVSNCLAISSLVKK